MVEKLIFVEFQEEADRLIQLLRLETPDKFCVIPLSLRARLSLIRANIPFQDTLSCFDSNAHARCMEQSEEWLKLLESIGEWKSNTVTMQELVFCIRPFINYLLWLVEIIHQAFKMFEPMQFWGPAGLQPKCNTEWKMNPAYRPLGYVIDEFAQLHELPYQCINGENQTQNAFMQGKRSYSEPQPSLVARMTAAILTRLSKTGNKPLIFTATDSYGIDASMQQIKEDFSYCSFDSNVQSLSLRRLGGNVYRTLKGVPARIPFYAFPYSTKEVDIAVHTINTSLDRLIDEIKTRWNQQFKYRGLDMSPHLIYILDTGIRQHLIALQYQNHRLRPMLKKLQPKIVITPFGSGIYSLLGEASREMDIPSMIITHGSHVPPKNPVEEIEQRRLTANLMLTPNYQYTAAQSVWAAKHAQYFKQQDRTLKTGPILFATTSQTSRHQLRTQLELPEDASVIVYAVAQRKRSSTRFHVYETEDEYLQHMKDLVKVVNSMEKTWLILKLHPSSEFSNAEMRTILPKSQHLHILHREPFQQVLSASDLLVSYGSTVIEEALLNRIPVVQYDRWKRYCHIDAYECNQKNTENWMVSAAYYVTQPELLKAVLEYALAHSKEARENPQLYDKHLLRPGQFMSLSHHLKTIVKVP